MRNMVKPPSENGLPCTWIGSAAGAQTERRGGAGPVGGLLGGKDRTGRIAFFCYAINRRSGSCRCGASM
jgi:hypothetical protein